MNATQLRSESISFQWNFFERAVNNYSIIMRVLNCFNDEDSLISKVPKIFVEESLFDMCKIVHSENGAKREGFFSLENSLVNVDVESIRDLSADALSPSLLHQLFGYGLLYIYPLRRDIQVLGYLVLGKKIRVEMDKRLLRELEIVCDIYNKALLLSTDVSERRKTAHGPAKVLHEQVLEEHPDALLLIDRNGFIGFANRRARKEFETSKGLLIGERLENIVSGFGEDFFRKEGPAYGEVNFRDGETYKVYKTQKYPVTAGRNKPGWQCVILKDEVEKRIRDEEYVAKEKMDSIGMLAGGIAHDFNNLLTGVLGYASMIKNFVTGEQKLHRYAEAIEHSAQRAAKLTQHLLNFSRRQRRKTGTVDLNGLLEDILFLVGESFRDIRIDKKLCNALMSVRGDDAELQNVFLNLCMNAKDAMAGKGSLKVTTDRRKMGLRELAVVEIEDTGPGISEHIKSRIFEPYFSTKETGTNLGMGLYLVDKAIREHGGFIELETEEGKGTKFSVYLPLPVEVTERAVLRDEPGSDQIIRRRKILVVDDEDVVREFLKGVLLDEGADVAEASDGESALRYFSQNHHAIDLVILDMIMPGMKGDEVLMAMHEIRQDVRVIICSGYMGEDQRDRLKSFKVDGFLDKPFRDKDLVRSVITALARRTAGN